MSSTPLSTARAEPALPDWQLQMRGAIRSLDRLLTALGLDPRQVDASEAAGEEFPLLVTPAMLRRMRPGDPRDPLLLQLLPRRQETAPQPAGFSADPLAETSLANGHGVLQKYAGRLLVVSTGACAVHCRYCFRRHFPYSAHQGAADGWQALEATLGEDPSISELILSGGDPLMLSNRRLGKLFERLRGYPQLRRLRLHSRVPVVLPTRVDDGLLALLAGLRLPTVMVLHINHPRELDEEACLALSRLAAAGVRLLNQAVLLRDVNDTLETQRGLWEGCFEAGVLPYYLHLLDPVAGAAHFDVPEAEARALVAALRACLPGYLVPRLAREVPGEPAKTVLA